MEIHKKILPGGYYEKLVSGAKKCELRLADEELVQAKPGDVLVLDEYTSLDHATRQPTGRSVRKEITDVQHISLDEILKWWPREELAEKGCLLISFKD